MKLHLETNIAEGTPEELVAYLRLVEEGEKNSGNGLFSFGHAHQPDEDTLKSLVGSLVKVADSYTGSTKLSVDEAVEEAIEEEEEEPSTGLQVGDKVRVLKSACGAEGEATVTAILEYGEVEIAGTSKWGIYLPNWSSHVTLLEKIEEEEEEEAEEEVGEGLQVGDRVKVLESLRGAEGEATVTKVLEDGYVLIAGTDKHGNYLTSWRNNVINLEKIEEEEGEDILGYRYWYLEGTNFNKFVVLEASIDGYFRDSRGFRYTHKYVSKRIKPIDREEVREVFDDAKKERSLLKYYPTLDMFDKE